MSFIDKLIDLFDPLGSLAKICSIGGISLGILFYIFKDVLKKTVFASLTKQQSYKIIRLIIICSFIIAILGTSIFAFLKYEENPKPVPNRYKDSIEYEPLKLEKKGVEVIDSTRRRK